MESNCQQIAAEISEIQKLKAGFDMALHLNELDKARAIQSDLENKIAIFYEQVVPLEFRELIKKESEVIEGFFGKHIDVPPLPKSITLEKFKYWESIGFELHYLPKEEMTPDKDFPGWINKPEYFFEQVQRKRITKDSSLLNGEWVLVDGRPKPDGEVTVGEYSNDSLGETLVVLRKVGAIQKDEHRPLFSRYLVSCNELNSDALKTAFAELLRANSQDVCLPRAIEWNYLGNAFHPEWGETSSREWFQDNFKNGHHLYGGSSILGGLSNVYHYSPVFRGNDLGFRLMVRFPK
ncbi:hypothetical protein EPO05_05125 [Patescibacteria group bacterium]|nr:MAG: hypothetical protein EPO05_05125 [Patescibacteria group bacterium]